MARSSIQRENAVCNVRQRMLSSVLLVACMPIVLTLQLSGCAGRPRLVTKSAPSLVVQPAHNEAPDVALRRVPSLPDDDEVVQPVVWRQPEEIDAGALPDDGLAAESLSALVVQAEAQNPRLRALRQEADAARAKAGYVDKLPDPTVAANVFAAPIETAAGAQTANMTVMQRIPWLGRLDAQSRRAYFEYLAHVQVYRSERLKVIADIRAAWFRLYVLNKQVEVNEAHQTLLQSLIRVADGRVAAGRAAQGDVLLGTLELSRLSDQLLTLRQQVASNRAELNRLVGRPAEFPVPVVDEVDAALPDWSHEQLRQLAIEQQPDVAAAVLRVQASRWGMEVARLERRPDVSLGASWYAIDDNRPLPNIVDVGRDAWSLGVQVSVPLWRQKYDAMEREAASRHLASHAGVDDVVNRYDALLRDLWEQARAASETADLYRGTILPQAEQTLKADQESYSTGAVEFDRVVGDLRNVVTLQLEYHRAEGRLAIALARIRQAVGVDLSSSVPPSGLATDPPPTP